MVKAWEEHGEKTHGFFIYNPPYVPLHYSIARESATGE